MRLLRDKAGNAYMTHASSRLSAWRKKVKEAIQALNEEPFEGAVRVTCYFRLPRPLSVRRPRPTVKPDLDKLVRASLDALEASGLVRTDAQVVSLTAGKVYAWDEPGMELHVEEMN